MKSATTLAILVGTLAALLLSGCSSHQSDFVAERDDVSMVRLLATPGTFEGRQIATRGFLHMDTNAAEYVLYLGETDYRHHLSRNAIAVSFPLSIHQYADRLSDRYVWVRGVFSDAPEKRGRHGGAFTEVALVDVLPTPDEQGPTNAVFLRLSGNKVQEASK